MAGSKLDLGNLLVHIRADATQYTRTMKGVVSRMKHVVSSLHSIGRQLTYKVILPLAALATASVKAFSSFDDAMERSLIIMKGVTPYMKKELTEVALLMARESTISAKNLAKGYFYLASAGFNAKQSLSTLPAVLEFATAGNFDMAIATDLATDAQSALGLTVKDVQQNLENMRRVTDSLLAANTLANATTLQFSHALTSQAGPAMKAYNIELEEGLAVLAAYADQGIKAQTGGHMFGRMLRLTTAAAMRFRPVWKELGLDIYKVNNKLKPMATIVDDLSKSLLRLAPKQRIATLNMLGFMARSQQAVLPLLGLGGRIRQYNKDILRMRGLTKEMAEKYLKSFTGQMKNLWNNIVDVAIAIGRRLAPTLMQLSDWFKNNQNKIKDWSIYFADRLVFMIESVKHFLSVMKTDFETGFGEMFKFFAALGGAILKTAIDIGLRIGKGMAAAIADGLAIKKRVYGQEVLDAYKALGGKLDVEGGEIVKIRQQALVINEKPGSQYTPGDSKDFKVDPVLFSKAKQQAFVSETFKGLGEAVDGYWNNIFSNVDTGGALEKLHSKDEQRQIITWWNNVSAAARPYVMTIDSIKSKVETFAKKSPFDALYNLFNKPMMPLTEEQMMVDELINKLTLEASLVGKTAEEREKALKMLEASLLVEDAYLDDAKQQKQIMADISDLYDNIIMGKIQMDALTDLRKDAGGMASTKHVSVETLKNRGENIQRNLYLEAVKQSKSLNVIEREVKADNTLK
jgi:TP901 family phage tail tape measure protein